MLYTAMNSDYGSQERALHFWVLKYVDLKQVTADVLVEMIDSFVSNKKEINSDKKRLKDQVKQSSSEIRKVAQQTLREVKDLVGLMNV